MPKLGTIRLEHDGILIKSYKYKCLSERRKFFDKLCSTKNLFSFYEVIIAPIDVDNFVDEHRNTNEDLKSLMDVICKYFNYFEQQILSEQNNICKNGKNIFCYIAKTHLNLSLKEIAKYLNCHISCVSKCYRKVKDCSHDIDNIKINLTK